MPSVPQTLPPLGVEDAQALREFIDLVRGLSEQIDLEEADSMEGAADMEKIARYWFEIVLEKAPGDRSLPLLLKEFSQLTDEDVARYLKG